MKIIHSKYEIAQIVYFNYAFFFDNDYKTIKLPPEVAS